MRILHISDTHGQHRQLTDLPEADVIVHSGDFTFAGTIEEATDFMDWFCDLPYKYKVFIAGNHDHCLYEAELEGLDNNTYYLCSSSIEIEGIKFHGVPMFMGDVLENRYVDYIASIPNDVDVLISHQPPMGIMDLSRKVHYGESLLLRQVKINPPRLHLFGHIHDAYGQVQEDGVIFSNAAIVDDQYVLTNTPRVYEI